MSFETVSLLLGWMEMGLLLAILFRLSSTFNLIANTQRELDVPSIICAKVAVLNLVLTTLAIVRGSRQLLAPG